MGTCSSYSLMPSKSPINLVASNNNNNLLSLTVSMGQELEIGLVGQVLAPDLSDGCRWLGLKSSESSLIHIVWHWAEKTQIIGAGTPHQSWSYTIHNASTGYGIFKHKQSGIHHPPTL